MLTDCENCSQATGTVRELIEMINKGEASTALHVLTETLAHDANLHQPDKCAVASLMHTLTSALQEKLAGARIVTS